jgi:hypothetical protein
LTRNIFLQDSSKRNHCLYRRPADFSYEKPTRDRELCIWCMMVEVLIKSYQNKWVILGQELTETTSENREISHNANSATSSRFLPHWCKRLVDHSLPPFHNGDLMLACLARPVPFWGQGLRPPPGISALVRANR